MWGWGPASALAQSLVSVVGGVIWKNKFTGFWCITKLCQLGPFLPTPASRSFKLLLSTTVLTSGTLCFSCTVCSHLKGRGARSHQNF